MVVYIFMSLSIILGIVLLLDFFGYFSRFKDKYDIEIEDYSAERRHKNIDSHRNKHDNRQNNNRKAA